MVQTESKGRLINEATCICSPYTWRSERLPWMCYQNWTRRRSASLRVSRRPLTVLQRKMCRAVGRTPPAVNTLSLYSVRCVFLSRGGFIFVKLSQKPRKVFFFSEWRHHGGFMLPIGGLGQRHDGSDTTAQTQWAAHRHTMRHTLYVAPAIFFSLFTGGHFTVHTPPPAAQARNIRSLLPVS